MYQVGAPTVASALINSGGSLGTRISLNPHIASSCTRSQPRTCFFVCSSSPSSRNSSLFTNHPSRPVCPHCATLLTVSQLDDGLRNRLECRTCPYQLPIDPAQPIYSRKNFHRVQREDVFGGKDQWKNAQRTRVQCARPGCDGEEAAFYQLQIRSADEPMTSFYHCMKCSYEWRD